MVGVWNFSEVLRQINTNAERGAFQTFSGHGHLAETFAFDDGENALAMIRSGDGTAFDLVLEPWAQRWTLSRGQQFFIAGRGGRHEPGFELEVDDPHFIIWGWQGAEVSYWYLDADDKIIDSDSFETFKIIGDDRTLKKILEISGLTAIR